MRKALFLATVLMAAGPAAHAQTKGVSLYPDIQKAQSETARALGAGAPLVVRLERNDDFNRDLQQAIARHPLYSAQNAQLAVARAQTKAARAALYPRISANVNADYVISRRFATGTNNVVESLRPDEQINAGVTASQLLFDGGASSARIKSAKARRREGERSIEARINELALSALSKRQDVAIHRAMLAIGEEYVARHERLVASVRERERLGAGVRADVLRAEARLAAARARVAEIDESARIAAIRYREFFGEAPADVKFPNFEALAVGSQEEAVSLALRANPLIAAAAARTDSMHAEVSAAKGARLPELRASVSGGAYDLASGGDDYDVRAGVSLNYDLYAGGARGAAIAEAKSAAERQSHEEAQIRQEIEREAAIAFERSKSAVQRFETMRAALVANYEARNLVSERFRASRGDLTDLMQAENDWFEAGLGYLASLGDRDMASYELMEFTGDLLRHFSPREEDRLKVVADE